MIIGVCWVTKKIEFLGHNLRMSTEDRILFPVSGPQVKFFRAKTRLKNVVGMLE